MKISANALVYEIPYGAEMLHDISFEIKSGEICGVLGENGAGKSTLLELIHNERQAKSGSLLYDDEKISSSIRKDMRYISQELCPIDNMTISEYLFFIRNLFPKYLIDEEKKMLDCFKLDSQQKISTLSLGNTRKVLLIGALCSAPKIILIDEISAVLDVKAREKLFDVLRYFNQKYKYTIVFATNIESELKSFADKILFIADKTIKVSTPDKINELFGLKEAA